VLAHYNLAATGAGKDRAVLCPFHEEQKPSCKIELERKIFHCFGCGTKGNVLEFVARIEGNPDDLRAAAFTLAGALKHLTCPLLVVHSGRDAVVPVEESERIRAEASGPASLVVFPEGNHVCDNIPYKVRPLMADWMAETLGA
jgi:hypothetical protein